MTYTATQNFQAESDRLLDILKAYAFDVWNIDADDIYDEFAMGGSIDAHIWVEKNADMITLFQDSDDGQFVITFCGVCDETFYPLGVYSLEAVTSELLDMAFDWALDQGRTLF